MANKIANPSVTIGARATWAAPARQTGDLPRMAAHTAQRATASSTPSRIRHGLSLSLPSRVIDAVLRLVDWTLDCGHDGRPDDDVATTKASAKLGERPI
ncbi:hypothetical protein N7467_011392 [Penicillium canescens]|nr:hypothetical protein N7467_011392 [Penicillium canescens]